MLTHTHAHTHTRTHKYTQALERILEHTHPRIVLPLLVMDVRGAAMRQTVRKTLRSR